LKKGDAGEGANVAAATVVSKSAYLGVTNFLSFYLDAPEKVAYPVIKQEPVDMMRSWKEE